jgi:hypothetical protein
MSLTREQEVWREWLDTPDGKGYEAGWGDLWTQLHAARGKEWVLRKMLQELRERVIRMSQSPYPEDIARDVDTLARDIEGGRA